MKKKYISWSQFYLYQFSPSEYFEQYILNLKKEPTKKMLFGRIFSDAYENRGNEKYDPCKVLRREGFTADYERVIKNALSQLPIIKGEECERTFEIENEPFNLLGKFDGVVESKNLIIENKTGATWTQQRTDEAEQLTFYGLVYYLTTGKNPKMILNSVRASDGKVVTFKTQRDIKQLSDFKIRVEKVANLIKNEVWE